MISFKSFVSAIHDAILTANEQLMDKNISLLDKYFIDTDANTDIQGSLDDALKTSQNISNKKGNVTREDLQNASDVFAKAKNALSGSQSTPNNSKTPGTLTPKTVVMEYPRETENGMESVEVQVPLLTLAPLSMSKIEKATLIADFELEIVDDEVQICFIDEKRRRRKDHATRGSLEITISPQDPSEGLKILIEGYEKALRSQIP
jgi:hypothetical protein